MIKLINKAISGTNDKKTSDKKLGKIENNLINMNKSEYISMNKSHISINSKYSLKDTAPKFSFSEVIAIDTIKLIFRRRNITIKGITKELRIKNARI